MDEQGLAAQGQMQGQQGPTTEQMVQKVAELLAQGVTPEQLLEKGVPQEIIDMAMRLLQQGQQSAPQMPMQPAQVMTEDGLASRGMM